MNDDGKSYLKQLKDIKFIVFDICRCTIDGLPKAFDEIKESLERLEKLEKVVEILKSKEVFEFKDDNCLYLNAEDHNWWGDIIEDSFVRLSEEENDLLKEVFGEWKNT